MTIKKILLMLTVIMVLLLGACVSSNSLNEYKEELDDVSLMLVESQEELAKMQEEFVELQKELLALQEEVNTVNITTEAQLEILESQLETFEVALTALQTRLDNMTSTVGLNDQVVYYENVESITQTMGMIQTSIIQLKDTFDKDRAPEYISDEFGNYVSFEQLGYKLKAKYFDDDTIHEVDMFDNGTDAFLRIGITSEMTEEEVLARMLLLVNELRNYAHYALNCNRVIVHVYRFADYDHQTKLSINQTIILNDYFIILPEGAYSEDYDIKLETDTELDLVLLETYYDYFILNDTFDGFVLNFTK